MLNVWMGVNRECIITNENEKKREGTAFLASQGRRLDVCASEFEDKWHAVLS